MVVEITIIQPSTREAATMVKDLKLTEPFNIEIKGRTVKRLQSLNDLITWTQNQKEFVDILKDSKNLEGIYDNSIRANVSQRIQRHTADFNQIQQIIYSIESCSDSDINNLTALADNLAEGIKNYISTTWLLYESQISRHAIYLMDNDPSRAYAFLIAKCNAIFQNIWDLSTKNASFANFLTEGVVEKKLFELGTKGSFRSARKQFDDIVVEVKQEIQRLNDETQNVQSQNESWIDDYQKRISEWENAKNKLEEDAQAQRERFDEEFEKQRAFFIEELQFQSPITYWKRVSKECKTKARWFTGIFGIACALFLFLHLEIGKLLIGNVTYSDPSALWLISFSFLCVALGVWSLRLIARTMLSYMHRHTDAEQRRTMVQTYLALRHKEGAETFKEHSGTILEALFRPTADGLVKDDALPLSYLETLARARNT